MFITWPFSITAALVLRAAFKTFVLLATLVVMFFAGVALAQAGDSPTAPHTATPVTTQPVIVPVMTPAAPAVAQQAPAPSWSWGELIAGVFLALVAWFVKNVQPKVHAALDAVANDPSKAAPVRTLAHLGEDLEPLVVSMVGHIVPDVQAAVAAGKDPGTVTKDAAQDVVDGLAPALKDEATKFLGPAGGAITDFVEGLIKSKLQQASATQVAAAQTAGVAAAKDPAAVAKAMGA